MAVNDVPESNDTIHSQTLVSLAQRVPIEELAAHLPTLEAELDHGRYIQILSGNRLIAEMRTPEKQVISDKPPGMSERPDFAARLKEMWGDRVFEDSTQSIRQDRDAGY